MEPTDVEILRDIRDQTRIGFAAVTDRLERLERHQIETVDRLGNVGRHQAETVDRLGRLDRHAIHTVDRLGHLDRHAFHTVDRLDRAERRQTESEIRLATEIVAVAGAIHEVRDLLRGDRALRDRVDDHERRLAAIENPSG